MVLITNSYLEENAEIQTDSYEIISIQDPELKSVLNGILGQAPHEKISKAQLAQIEKIESKNRNISNLDGLQYCINLSLLNLNGNQISDISALSNLINLRYLYLEGNRISDISSMKKLTKLIGARLGNQKIKLEKITLNSTKVEIENNIKNLNGKIVDDIYDISNNGKNSSETNLIKWDNIKQKGILKYNFRESVNIGGALTKFSGTVEQPVEINKALKRRMGDNVVTTSLIYIIGEMSIILLTFKVMQKKKKRLEI